MAYNKTIELQIDTLIRSWPNMGKKKMFGGVCYLIHGNMCFGILQEYLIVRTDITTAQTQLQKEYVRPFDVTGKPMKGWLMVSCDGWTTEETLNTWLAIGRDFALSLPEK